MDQEINNQIVEPVAKTPHPVNQVTVLSKTLAALIFIAMPFAGGYIGYQLAPEKVVEVPIVNKAASTQVVSEESSRVNVSVNNGEVYQDKDYPFSLKLASDWRVLDLSEESGLALYPRSLKNILLEDTGRQHGIIIAVVPIADLEGIHRCHNYRFSSSTEKWIRVERKLSDDGRDCVEKEFNADVPSVDSNFTVGNTPSLLEDNEINPRNLAIPLNDKIGLNITIINWSGSSSPSEIISTTTKMILDSLAGE